MEPRSKSHLSVLSTPTLFRALRGNPSEREWGRVQCRPKRAPSVTWLYSRKKHNYTALKTALNWHQEEHTINNSKTNRYKTAWAALMQDRFYGWLFLSVTPPPSSGEKLGKSCSTKWIVGVSNQTSLSSSRPFFLRSRHPSSTPTTLLHPPSQRDTSGIRKPNLIVLKKLLGAKIHQHSSAQTTCQSDEVQLNELCHFLLPLVT